MYRYAVGTVLLLLVAVAGFGAEIGDMKPYAIDWDRSEESVVDLSGYLDAPAGKEGFIRMKGDKLVKPDGSRFRIWGVNITSGYSFPPKEEAPKIAADLARYGINCVRFHHMDASWGNNIFDNSRNDTQRLDAEQIDKLDFLIAEMKKRGVYANLNLNVSRRFKEGDGVRDYKKLGYAKGATYFNRRIIDLQKDYARQLMTHYNPYTRNEYRNEPAIAVVEMVNENSLVEAWVNWRLVGKKPEEIEGSGSTWTPLPISYTQELTEQYNEWLNERASMEEMALLWKETGTRKGQLIPRLRPDQFAKASRIRFQAEAMFLMQKEADFFNEMKRLLKDEVGVQSLLVGSGDHNDSISGYAHIRSNMIFDIIDGHGYWQHPSQNPFRMKNTPMVNDPFDSTVTQFARTPVVGRPYTISETNHPFPAEHASEGIPILTAYSLFHDWDGIYWFALGQPRQSTRQKAPLRSFDFGNEPVKMAEIAACGHTFHRQDVETFKRIVVRSYNEDEVNESLRMPRSERPFFTKGFARSTPLLHATRLTFGGKSTLPFPEKVEGVLRSDSGELVWYHDDKEKGVVTIETDCTQALIGFVKARGKSVRNLAADVDNEFCTIYCTSFDGKPIAKAGELLLLTGGRVANSGMQLSEDRHEAPQWGKYPPVIETIAGAILLRDLDGAKGVTAQPLAAEGRPLGNALKAKRTGNIWRIPLADPPTVWYRLRVER